MIESRDEPAAASFPVLFTSPGRAVHLVQPGLWLVAPEAGTRDTGETAAANVAAMGAHLPSNGRPIVILVLLDRMVSQDRAARQVYASWGQGVVDHVVLVGGTPLARVLISFQSRFNPGQVPIRASSSLLRALDWSRPRVGALGWEAE